MVNDLFESRWDIIFDHYNIPITQGNIHYPGPCPLCKKKGKFRLFNKWILDGSYICTCSAGNGFKLIMKLTNEDFNTTLANLKKLLDIKNKPYVERKVDLMKKMEPLNTFNEKLPISGTEAHDYLKSRNIRILPWAAIRYSKDQYFDKYNKYNAMYAIATTDGSEIAYNHCTYLINGTKIEHENSKKQFKINNVYPNNIAIRMFPLKKTDTILGLSEGIETGLSCAQMYDHPVWATMTSNFMKKFIAPKKIEKLIIYADNDSNGTGLEAAFACGRANILTPNDVVEVDILWPMSRGDFNDVLKGDIPNEIVSWNLDKKK